jgi:transposase
MSRTGGKPSRRRITGGVDTHGQTHHAAVELMNGARVADAEFPATSQGYASLLEWMHSYGRLHAVGVEGTGSYGAGLARYLHAHGVTVIEVSRPDRAQRRAKGKSDPLDAYAAAGAVLAGKATATPKPGTGIIESIRVLHTVRAGAVRARTAAINELRSLLITAPAPLREHLDGLSRAALVTASARLRPAADTASPAAATRLALRALARRHQALTTEITELDAHLARLVAAASPALRALHGVGDETAAQLLVTTGDNPHRLRSLAAFAALCGAAPIPASSGKTTRHRLSRGGDRQANRALYIIAISRMSTCTRTRAYVERRTTQGLSKPEIIRCLKRYIAREIYNTLTRPAAPANDLQTAA